jgi:hypothetical protein
MAAGEFSKSSFPKVLTNGEMRGIRMVFAFLLAIDFVTALIVHQDKGITYLFSMFSYWAEFITLLSLIYSEKAANDKYSH